MTQRLSVCSAFVRNRVRAYSVLDWTTMNFMMANMIMVSLWWCHFTLPPPITHWTTRRSLSIVDWPAGKGPSSWWSTLFKMIDCLRNVTFVHFLTALAALFLHLFWDMEKFLRKIVIGLIECRWMFCILAYRSNSTRKVCPHIDFPIFPNFPNQKERKRDDDDDYLCNTDWHD